MRNLILWTLSFLLGFEPALMAAGNARQNAEIKAFIEMTGVTKRSVTFRELYSKISPYLPQAQKDELAQFIQEYGDMKLPKLDASKFKISGSPDEAYKLQVVTKGQAGSIEIFNDNKQFLRVNGETITDGDMVSAGSFMEKLGLPSREVASTFQRQTLPPDGRVNATDLSRMSKSDQAVYFKQTRELLASMEAVQVQEMKIKSAMLEPQNKFEVVLRWLAGEAAFALGSGEKCTAAGYNDTEVAYNGPRLTCGTDGKGGVPEQFRKKGANSFCEAKQFACNPVVFGVNQNKESFCVAAGPTTTAQCMQKAGESGTIMPNLNDKLPRDQFDAELAKIKDAAKAVVALCDKNESGIGRGGKANPALGLIEDQSRTCVTFREHEKVVAAWDCNTNETFKKKYEAVCKAKVEDQRQPATPANPGTGGADGGKPPVTGQPTPAPGTPAQGGADGQNRPPTPQTPARPAGEIACSDMPKKYSTTSGCAAGIEKYADRDPKKPSFTICDDGKKKYKLSEIYWCACKDDAENPDRNTCLKKGEKDPIKDDADKKKEKGFWDKNKKWLIPLGFGLLGLGLFHWLAKSQVKQQYQYLEPEPVKPPAPPPAAPVPRGTN
jgi:hypothetical protein